MKRLSSLLLCSAACLTSAWGQTLTSIEAVEYEPNSDRWVVSNGSSMLMTADEGVTWGTFGSGGATHGMEVVGSTLFAIQNNVLRAYDVVTESQIGSVIPIGVTFLNGMGSYSNDEGDFLVVSDFGTGRILKVDVTDPSDMQVSTLVDDTGTTPGTPPARCRPCGIRAASPWSCHRLLVRLVLINHTSALLPRRGHH